MITQRTHIPLARAASQKKPKRGMSKLSKRMMALKRTYKQLSRDFLLAHPYCQHFMAERGIDERVAIDNMGIVLCKTGHGWEYVHVPRAAEIHHRKGRGKYYLDVSTWMAVRPGHSEYIHGANTAESYRKGYLLPRN